jgi:phosphoglycolate phosphatase
MYIFFDLDGTLCDPREGIIRCLKYALDRLGYPAPQDNDLERYIGPPLYESFGTLLQSSDAQLISRAVELYRQRFASQGIFENTVYDGMGDALDALRRKDFRLYVVTSKPSVFATPILEHVGLRKYFDRVYGSELDGTRADKSALIAHVLAEERLPAANAIMVGDREHDVRGALANGVTPVGALWGYGSREELQRAGASLLYESPGALSALVSSRQSP